jgi:hypothetical protein
MASRSSPWSVTSQTRTAAVAAQAGGMAD